MSTDSQNSQVRKILKEFEHMSYVELQRVLHRCLEERMVTDESLVAKVLEAKKYGLPEAAPVIPTGCEKHEELLDYIMDKMVRLMEIGSYSFKGPENWKEVGTIARQVNQKIRQHSKHQTK